MAVKVIATALAALALPAPTTINSRLLGAGSAESVTIPTGAKYVRLACSVTGMYVRYDGSAATVPGDVTDGTASEFVPPEGEIFREIGGVTVLSVISAGTPVVTASFYKDPGAA